MMVVEDAGEMSLAAGRAAACPTAPQAWHPRGWGGGIGGHVRLPRCSSNRIVATKRLGASFLGTQCIEVDLCNQRLC